MLGTQPTFGTKCWAEMKKPTSLAIDVLIFLLNADEETFNCLLHLLLLVISFRGGRCCFFMKEIRS